MKFAFEDFQAGKQPEKKGWDCADAVADGWTKDQLDAFMRATARPWTPDDDKPAEKPAERFRVVAGSSDAAPASKGVTEARTVEQAQPATVTHIRTRKTVAVDDGWQMELVTNEEGKTKPGVSKNWALFLENHPDTSGVFAFDAFKHRVMLMICPPWEDQGSSWTPRPVQDRDYSEAVMWLEAKYMTPKASNIIAVISTIAERSRFDPLIEYLEGIAWDGNQRVGRFANNYLGCRGENYAPIVSERWLISSVARGLDPGCKVDTMPILEGPQGARKSSVLEKLYGKEFFTDCLSDIASKDAKMEMQGVWGLEVAEMQKFNAAETNDVKKFLTQKVDRFRPPYGRSIIEAPRRVVICGTINPEGNPYLRDVTGARRFWPLEVGKIDLEGIERDRDQLWAEAVSLYRAGRQWWVDESEIATVEQEQEKRTDVDVWTDLIAPHLVTSKTIGQVEIFKDILGIPTKEHDKRHSDRVGRIMKKLGWQERRDQTDGDNRKVYFNPRFEPTQSEDGLDW